MDADIIWWSAIGLETLVLSRCIWNGLLRVFPFFFTYIVCILLTEFLRLLCLRFSPPSYPALFWNTEVVTIIASFGIVFEIFRQSFQHHAGIARVARMLLTVVFVATLSFAASDLWHGGFASLPRATVELGRDLRYVEGFLLLLMLWILGRYRILVGRNLLGLLTGYSVWIGLNVINYAFLFLPGHGFSTILRKALPTTFVVTLLIWCVSLWVLRPESRDASLSQLEQDYNSLNKKTRLLLLRTSNRILGVGARQS